MVLLCGRRGIGDRVVYGPAPRACSIDGLRKQLPGMS